MKNLTNNIEISAPVGDFDCLAAAIQAKADSIYFGLQDLNMRSLGAKNFTIKDLQRIKQECKKHNIKTYLTLNSIIYDSELPLVSKIIKEAKKAQIDAIVAFDLAVMQQCLKHKISCHASTQLNISNIEALKHYAKYCDVIVLARELSLDQIQAINQQIKKQKIKGPSNELIKLEIFIHGALCISISGKCYMSLANYNKSANRGECLQTCRRAFNVIDQETNQEMLIDNKYVMSPSDLCTLPYLDKILNTGVSILKIEGRARSPDYVYTTTKVYKEAIDSINNKSFSKDKIKSWVKDLKKVYNRGFWEGGYYLNKKTDEWAGVRGSKATQEKIFIGIVSHFFSKKSIAIINVQSQAIKKAQKLLIIGPTTGILEFKIPELYNKGIPSTKEEKGPEITIKVPRKVRKNDKVYLIQDVK